MTSKFWFSSAVACPGSVHMLWFSLTLWSLPSPSGLFIPPVSLPLTPLDPPLQMQPSLCLVRVVVWMLVGSSVLPVSKVKKRGKKKNFRKKNKVSSRGHPQKPVQCFSIWPRCSVCLFFSFPLLSFLIIFEYLFSSVCPYLTVCSILTWHNHTLKQQEGVLSICHMPSSVLDSTVISGLQYFSHCSQFLVQFYATFTWMFMTLSAATKV